MDYEKAWFDLFSWLRERNKFFLEIARSRDTSDANYLRLSYKADALKEVMLYMNRRDK